MAVVLTGIVIEPISMEVLHDDIKLRILSFLGARDLLALQACSTAWARPCCDRTVWGRLLLTDFEPLGLLSHDRVDQPEGLSLLSSSIVSPLRPATTILSPAITVHPYATYVRRAKALKMKRIEARERAETQVAAAMVRGE